MNAPIVEIDWDWVSGELLEKERIPQGDKGRIRGSADECLEKAKALAKANAVSSIKKIAGFRPDSIELEDSVIPSGRRLSSYIKGATDVYLFLVTLGDGIEKEASLLMSSGEPLLGYLLDRMGSFAVESLAEAMEDKLRKAYAPDGKSVSMRLSPGYCGWPVEGQRAMAKILDFSKAGVHLTESCMMIPRKSISAMVGIGPRGLFSKKSQCALCNRQDCDYRRPF